MTETLQQKTNAIWLAYHMSDTMRLTEVEIAINKAIQELREEIEFRVCGCACPNIACIELKNVLALIGEKK